MIISYSQLAVFGNFANSLCWKYARSKSPQIKVALLYTGVRTQYVSGEFEYAEMGYEIISA